MKKQKNTISQPEYMLLVAATAQKKAGKHRNPTPAELERSLAEVKVSMVKKGVAPSWTSGSDDELGSFWGRLKDAAASVLPSAKKAAPFAIPVLLASTAATPFMIKSILAAREAKKSEVAAKAAAAASSAANPPAEEPAESEAPAAEHVPVVQASTSEGAFVGDFIGEREGDFDDAGAVEREASSRFAGEFVDGVFVDGAFVGLDPWVHMLNPSYWFKSSREKRLIDAERKLGKENVSEQKRLSEQRKELQQAERTMATASAARSVKAEEENVEARLREIEQSVTSGDHAAEIVGSFVGDSIPNDVYRAAIWQRASKLSGGRPTTKAVAAAKKSIDHTLGIRGVSIKVPGARPGRVTR